MRRKVSWLRTLQDVDEAMHAGNLAEYEVSVETVRQAQIDGGYPTLQSMDEVAQKFGLICDFGLRMAIIDDGPPPIKPMCKFRRIAR